MEEPNDNKPVIGHKESEIRDENQHQDEMQSFSLGTAAAIGAMLGALKLSPNSNAERDFDEVMKIIASLQLPKVSKSFHSILNLY